MSAECDVTVRVSGPVVSPITILGVKIDLLTAHTLIDLVCSCITTDHKIVIANHNLHSLCLYHNSTRDTMRLRAFYHDADYTLADGMSMVLLGKLQGKMITSRHRIAYNDWLPIMLPIAARNRWRLFYLGSTDTVANKGVEILRARFPDLLIESHHGHFDAQHGSLVNSEVIAEINRHSPHILFVGMGMPRQEQWIYENRRDLTANVILSSGATLDYIAGAKRMAPRWLGIVGLEWAFRLITEPRRLAHRYLVEPWGLVGVLLANALRLHKG